MMNGGPVIQFNYETWIARYPKFSSVPSALAELYFNEAGLYFSNCGWTAALPIAPTLLNMLTAHIAQLNATVDGQPATSLVGRINSAAEGSVNVAVEYNSSGSPSEAFFTQTEYGTAFWQATAQFRTARYVVNPWQRGGYGGFGPYGGYGRGY